MARPMGAVEYLRRGALLKPAKGLGPKQIYQQLVNCNSCTAFSVHGSRACYVDVNNQGETACYTWHGTRPSH
jgi:hypothetical protein